MARWRQPVMLAAILSFSSNNTLLSFTLQKSILSRIPKRTPRHHTRGIRDALEGTPQGYTEILGRSQQVQESGIG
ncbi:hypothetical protein BDZ97DRAFT_1791144 [Flammula alnicola]|nr:hypothetical protein BDZ97DRAFT_1811782 [Flammula alnicola]KAF8970391.1 hypothetical protein BDZ97DRAFT_1791144 [Flammula alnicola]